MLYLAEKVYVLDYRRSSFAFFLVFESVFLLYVYIAFNHLANAFIQAFISVSFILLLKLSLQVALPMDNHL